MPLSDKTPDLTTPPGHAPTYHDVPIPGFLGGRDWGTERAEMWRQGVVGRLKAEAAKDAVLKDPEVVAFVEIVKDDPDKARQLVQTLSGQDRAVLLFHLSELSRLVEDAEMVRQAAGRKAARLSYPDGYDT